MSGILALFWSVGLRALLIWGGVSLAAWILVAVVIYIIVT